MRLLVKEASLFIESLPSEGLAPDQHLARATDFFCETLSARDLPKAILAHLFSLPLNPVFGVDITTNPAQVTICRRNGWHLLMYVWLKDYDDSKAPPTAHDHSSYGVSFIHTGTCYREWVYALESDRLDLISKAECIEGEIKVIAPTTIHSVRPLGGYSFNLWAPRHRNRTRVFDTTTSYCREETSEHDDAVLSLRAKIASNQGST